MVVRTTLKIDRELLKQIKDVAFDKNITQNDLIVKYLEYCVENEIEVNAND